MKFSEIERKSWPQLQPYMDTCLLPVTGLTGEENPWQASEALERLRDVLEGIEIPFKGRIVVYPAVQYWQGDASEAVRELCHRLKHGGFRYIVVASAAASLTGVSAGDLVISPDGNGQLPNAEAIREQITALWKA